MADFSAYRKITFADILDYVDKEHPDYRDELVQAVTDGKRFLEIKNDFYAKFFPNYIPVAKPKKPTMKELLGIKDEEPKEE